VMVDDLGQVLNPMIVNGQQHGEFFIPESSKADCVPMQT